MSYRHPRYHGPVDNTIEGTIDGIGQVCVLVVYLVGIFVAPIALWHLNDSFSKQTHTVEPSIPLERAK